MEPRQVLRPGAGNGHGGLNTTEIERRLRRHVPVEETHLCGSDKRRGDDDLNPGMLSEVGHLVDAAVLVPLIRREEGPHLLLTRRTMSLSAHAGQIAFPGGRVEAWDASPTAAALREAEEEIGLPPEAVEVIGRLDTYITRTGYRVTPVVGLSDPPECLEANPHEVSEIFEVPLAFLLDPEVREVHTRRYDGRDRHYYAFPYGDYYIWGATAGMLVNLMELLEQPC